jgi:Cupin superfamily protein
VKQEWTLDSLLSPITASSFLGEMVGRKLLRVPGHSGKFGCLISWQELNDILSRSALSFPRLRLARDNQDLRVDAIYRFDSFGVPRLRLSEVNRHMGDGAILTIESVEHIYEPFSELAGAVERSLRVPISIRLEAACSDSGSSRLRWNDHHVIILQTSGKCRIVVYGATRSFPTTLDSPDEPTGEPQWEQELCPGSLLHIPRGWWYRTTSVAEPSLRVTIQFRIPTGVDIATRILGRLNQFELMRVDYPLFATSADQSAYLTQLQAEVVRECRKPGLILDFFNEMWASSEPRNKFTLPWAAARPDSSILPTDYWVIPLTRFPLSPDLDSRDSGETIYGGSKIQCDGQVKEIITHLFDHAPISVGSLGEILQERHTQENLILVLSMLLKQGIIALRPGTGRETGISDQQSSNEPPEPPEAGWMCDHARRRG